jgi:hypothetical protein
MVRRLDHPNFSLIEILKSQVWITQFELTEALNAFDHHLRHTGQCA